MPRLAQKSDSSFFKKIALGVIGTRRVSTDLARHGHQVYELERGSLDTKLWKEVKRKRVRMPDLVCARCGIRIESRAKTKPELSMSHSLTDANRAWDFGMVNSDLIAFPVCRSIDDKSWTLGRLGPHTSYWHERNWVKWQTEGGVNYFTVEAFRGRTATATATKGVTEGSETTLSWAGDFSTRTGTVEVIDDHRVTIRRNSDGHRHTRTVRPDFKLFVAQGDAVSQDQIIAGHIEPLLPASLQCAGHLPPDHIRQLLDSRVRTQRFTGVKLARLVADAGHAGTVAKITADEEEDVYIRLEGASYLTATCNAEAGKLFTPFLGHADPQVQLEAVIALGESDTPDSVALISEILDDEGRPHFLRSAAAWALSRRRDDAAMSRLINAFRDTDQRIREEALQGIVTIGVVAIPLLVTGLLDADADVASGCAEALRRQDELPHDVIEVIAANLRSPAPSPWALWLAGHLAHTRVADAVAGLEDTAPQLHYTLTLLRSFTQSWIARQWELNPGAALPAASEDR